MSEASSDLALETSSKITTAKEKKELGDQAFKNGKTTEALMSYHGALMYLLGLDKNALQSLGVQPKAPAKDSAEVAKQNTKVDDLIEKVYANMSACHMKNENWKRTIETAEKALAKNPNNFKAMFRKGKALGEQGFFDKAEKILEELKSKNPSDTAMVDTEIKRLRAIDNEREKAHRQKLKGFLNKDRSDKKTADSA